MSTRRTHHELITGERLSAELTSHEQYQQFQARRRVVSGLGGLGGLSGLSTLMSLGFQADASANPGMGPQAGGSSDNPQGYAIPRALKHRPGEASLQTLEKLTPEADVTSYNNYYEFGLDKAAPAQTAPRRLRVEPWSLSVEGLVAKPQTFSIEALMKLAPLEERVYRMRCVEGWSMVIPWVGLPLQALLKAVQPLGSAKFVEFVSLADPRQMPGLSAPVLAWPYREGLRLDEAQHPLTLLALGLYGKTLPAQNGAPVRLVVPWKYGFKGAKSIVKIRLLEQAPKTSWNQAAANEYGFYANVNPDVAHPRWSQATERRIGEGGLFAPRRPTQPFNGYADLVADLYRGMDLRRQF